MSFGVIGHRAMVTQHMDQSALRLRLCVFVSEVNVAVQGRAGRQLVVFSYLFLLLVPCAAQSDSYV